MKLFCYYTPSHEVFFKEWFAPTLQDPFELVAYKDTHQWCPSGSFRTEGWKQTQLNKLELWISACEKEDLFIGADVDIQWFAPTQDRLLELLGNHDIAFQMHNFPHHLNSGFFICRGNANTQQFWKMIYHTLKEAPPHYGEQDIITHYLTVPENTLRWCGLPRELFWTPNERLEPPGMYDIPPTALMHHATYVVGIDRKIQQLETLRYKYLHRKKGRIVSIGIRGAGQENMGAANMLDVAQRELRMRLPADLVIQERGSFQKPVDAIIDISGFAYSDTWGHAGVIAAQAACKIREENPAAPYFYLPQAFGPFQSPELSEPAKRAFNGAFIYPRDQLSLEYLQGLQPNAPLTLAPDIVFAHDFIDEALGKNLLAEAGVDFQRPIIGIYPNMRVLERNSRYIDALQSYLDIAREYGAEPVFIPHEIRNVGHDDREICKRFNAIGLTKAYTLAELRAISAHCDMVIGSRFHGLVLSLLQGIPAIGTGWAHKYETLFQEFGLSEYILPIELSHEERRAQVMKMWNHRQELSQQIQKRVVQNKVDLKRLFDQVAEQITANLGAEPQLSIPQPSPAPAQAGLKQPLVKGLHENHHNAANRFNFRRNIHRLEKGLILYEAQPEKNKAFAEDYIEETIGYLKAALLGQNTWENETLAWGVAVLNQYFQTVQSGPRIDKARLIYQSLPLSNPQPNWIPYPAKERPEISIDFEAFQKLAQRRRSIRFYEDRKPPHELIAQALETGLQAPSACNRQSFRCLYFDEPEMVQWLSRIPGGIQGYSLPAVMVVVGQYRGYFDERDIKCPIIDASLAMMGFLLALETLGLSSVCVNWPELPDRYAGIRQRVHIAEDEFVVMMIGIGYANPEGHVPYSAKRDISTMLQINPKSAG